jgi:hypothetical protein
VTIFARSCARLLQITHWLGSCVVDPGVGAAREASVFDLPSNSAAPLGAKRSETKVSEAERSANA